MGLAQWRGVWPRSPPRRIRSTFRDVSAMGESTRRTRRTGPWQAQTSDRRPLPAKLSLPAAKGVSGATVRLTRRAGTIREWGATGARGGASHGLQDQGSADMKKSDIVERVVGEAGVAKQAAEAAVDAVFGSIADARARRGRCRDRLRQVRQEQPAGPRGPESAHRRAHRHRPVGIGVLQVRQGAEGRTELTAGCAWRPCDVVCTRPW